MKDCDRELESIKVRLDQLQKDLDEHWRPSHWPDTPYGWECHCERCIYIRREIFRIQSKLDVR